MMSRSFAYNSLSATKGSPAGVGSTEVHASGLRNWMRNVGLSLAIPSTS